MDLSTHEGEMPIPISSTFVGVGVGQSHHHPHGIIHEAQLHHHQNHHHHHSSNGPPPPPPPLAATPISSTEDGHYPLGSSSAASKKGLAVRYRECLKNHAASIGGNATDGCGEFMPSGEEGSLEALKCSACGCHRNFHRKEIEGDTSASCECSHYLKVGGGGGSRKLLGGGHKGVLISSGPDMAAYSNSALIPRSTPHSMIMPLGAIQTSESDEMEGLGGGYPRPPMLKKRFRTKFSSEQKEKMLAFAEKVGWKLQKQEESVVQHFCQEIGVKRRVLKVWMHNNKHNLAKKDAAGPPPPHPQPPSLSADRMSE